jgi:2-keto-3-deoxy-L-rhamnonate aldolase RhmA
MNNAQHTQAPDREWFGPADLAGWLGLLDENGEPDVRAIYNMRATRSGPRAHRIAGKLRFRKADIEAWLAGRAAG